MVTFLKKHEHKKMMVSAAVVAVQSVCRYRLAVNEYNRKKQQQRLESPVVGPEGAILPPAKDATEGATQPLRLRLLERKMFTDIAEFRSVKQLRTRRSLMGQMDA